ncbi:tetratricopeptide repeat protein [Streptomyces sp. NPDC093272]|uniref:tetratricopeptide repeat protein n=1 Tax=Streptomyces sp. NPDC093272 TaxID=3154981 RepID=UPI003439AD62
MSTEEWPAWRLADQPSWLARYVLRDEVADLVRLPAAAGAGRVEQLRSVYEAIRGAGITYAYPADAGSSDGQVIRQPAEVLWHPRTGTCLDLALVLAAACLHAGLRPLVLILDSPYPGRPAHAVVAVVVDDEEAGEVAPRLPDVPVRDRRPDNWADLVQDAPDGPPSVLMVVDPVGMSSPLPTAPVLGAAAGFEDAVREGARYAAEWNWRLAVDLGLTWRARDVFPGARRPADLPLRDPYLPWRGDSGELLLSLRAEYAVVPFQARDELTVLTSWCREVAQGDRTGLAVVHGVGGAGKTRLALELADRLRTHDGWCTGYLREHTSASWDWLGEVVTPTLVVLDYAEARSGEAERLLSVLKRRLDRGAAPAVVVMTARSDAGQWLPLLREAWQRDGHAVRELSPLALPAEIPSGTDLFGRALRVFGHDPAAGAVPAPAAPVPREWTTLDNILLAALTAHGTDRVPLTRDDLYDQVLRHEHTHWAKVYRRISGHAEAAVLDGVHEELDRAVVSLTVRSAVGRAAIRDALDAADIEPAVRPHVVGALRTCLQPGPGEPLALRPDPVADHLIARQLERGEQSLAELVARLDPDGREQALQQVNRAGGTHPRIAADAIRQWMAADQDAWDTVLSVAIVDEGAALLALEQEVEAATDPRWLARLSDGIPVTAAGLPALGIRTDSRGLALARRAGFPDSHIADLLERLTERLRANSESAAALAAVQEAVAIRRSRALASPAARPALADALVTLARCHNELRDGRAAMDAITEAVDLYRALVRTDPEARRADLAHALVTLAGAQYALHGPVPALVPIGEAVALSRLSAESDREAHLPDLARALHNQGLLMSEAGDLPAALATVGESVELCRDLARNHRAAYGRELANALNTLATVQQQLGEHRDALASATESHDTVRVLYAINPAAFRIDLAFTLHTLALARGAVGNPAEAVAEMREATGLYRTLAEGSPDRLAPDLARAVADLAGLQGDAGDSAGALVSAAEAVHHWRTLADTRPDAFLPALGDALATLAGQQRAAGDRDAALDSAREAVRILRTLADRDDPESRVVLADALVVLSNVQGDDDDDTEALAAIGEAVEIRRELLAGSEARIRPVLAGALANLALEQRDAGDTAAALASATEAAGHFRILCEHLPEAHLGDYAHVLDILSGIHERLGDTAAAFASIKESVDILRGVAPRDDRLLRQFADALNNLSDDQLDAGDTAEALASVTEAVDCYRSLAERQPDATGPALARALRNLARTQTAAGDPAAALVSAAEAVALHRPLAQRDPGRYLLRSASALQTLSDAQADTGDPAAAVATLVEAVDQLRTLVRRHRGAFLPRLADALHSLGLRYTDTGDLAAALAAGTECVDLYRALEQGEPGTYTAELARALHNLAVDQSDGGTTAQATASATEAVTLYEDLAAADPERFLPSLARAQTHLSRLLHANGESRAAVRAITEAVARWTSATRTDPGHAPRLTDALDLLTAYRGGTPAVLPAWHAAIGASAAVPLERARIQAALAATLIEEDRTDTARDHLAEAARNTGDDRSETAGEIRQSIRRSVLDSGTPVDDRLPAWATLPLHDATYEALTAWLSADDPPGQEAVLTGHAHTLLGSDFAGQLETVRLLHPRPEFDRLHTVLQEIPELGLDAYLSERRTDRAVRAAVGEWIATRTWSQSKDHLLHHEDALRTPEAKAVLSARGDTTGDVHLAILSLLDTLSADHAYQVVTERDAALAAAHAALEAADISTLTDIVYAAQNLPADHPDTRLFSLVIVGIMAGLDAARPLAEQIRDTATPIQRRAATVRLRDLHRRLPHLTVYDGLAAIVEAEPAS